MTITRHTNFRSYPRSPEILARLPPSTIRLTHSIRASAGFFHLTFVIRNKFPINFLFRYGIKGGLYTETKQQMDLATPFSCLCLLAFVGFSAKLKRKSFLLKCQNYDELRNEKSNELYIQDQRGPYVIFWI